MILIPCQAFAYAIFMSLTGDQDHEKSNQEAVPYLCTVSSELDEPIDRNRRTVFPKFAAQAGGRETRRFIVPGYIFSIRKEGNAVQVPENEWRIIETLSDPHPSVINEQDEIISGPLTGICDLIRKTEKNRIQIRASLLGEERTYWVRVRRTERPPENKTAGTAQRKEEAEMEHTQEEINQILENAESVGIHAAAQAAGVPWQTVLRWARNEGKQIPSKKYKPAKSRTKKDPDTNEKSTTAGNPVLSPAEKENAVLKEHISQLEEKIRKLREAITELI